MKWIFSTTIVTSFVVYICESNDFILPQKQIATMCYSNMV